MSVQGRAYDWESLTIFMDGIPIGNVKSIDWSDTRGVTPTFGIGGAPRGFGRRNYRCQGSIEVADETWIHIMQRAGAVGGFYNLLFNLNLQYGDNATSKGYGPPMHEVLAGCRPSRRGAAARQGVAEAGIRRIEFECLGGVSCIGLGELDKF